MFEKLIKLLKQAIKNISTTDEVVTDIDVISNTMSNAIKLWEDMYSENAPWIDHKNGIYSLGIAKTICQEMKRSVLSEVATEITTTDGNETENTRAYYLNDILQNRLLKQLNTTFEKALALGGFIIKPYVSNNNIYFNYCFPGEFYPLQFDDEGNITDIAFIDQFTSGEYRYSRVERHIVNDNNTITITNKCYKARIQRVNDNTELGSEIPLTSVEKWQDITPETTITDMSKPLYAFFKVPIANNLDFSSPLGVSIFSNAVDVIERADKQFSRLDWEYEGGQIAIDVDFTAIKENTGYYGTVLDMDNAKNRIYRKIDLGSDDTYKAFTPTLRDNSYINGLNKYLTIIEDKCGVARGTISDVDSEAKTATEIKVLKQRQYITVSEIQDELEKTLRDIMEICNVLCGLYNLAPVGEYNFNIEWKDSILTDTATELEEKLNLKREGILSKAEIRSWYTGEDLEVAQTKIQDMVSEDGGLDDIFSRNRNDITLESGE